MGSRDEHNAFGATLMRHDPIFGSGPLPSTITQPGTPTNRSKHNNSFMAVGSQSAVDNIYEPPQLTGNRVCGDVFEPMPNRTAFHDLATSTNFRQTGSPPESLPLRRMTNLQQPLLAGESDVFRRYLQSQRHIANNRRSIAENYLTNTLRLYNPEPLDDTTSSTLLGPDFSPDISLASSPNSTQLTSNGSYSEKSIDGVLGAYRSKNQESDQSPYVSLWSQDQLALVSQPLQPANSWVANLDPTRKTLLSRLWTSNVPRQAPRESLSDRPAQYDGLSSTVDARQANAVRDRDSSPSLSRCSAPTFELTQSQHSKMFHPMMVLSENGQTRDMDVDMSAGVGQQGETVSADLMFSREYHGVHNIANASANIPNHLNCSLWLTKLPPDVTYHELIDMIVHAGRFGRLHCTFLNYPDNLKHQTAAAKVVFFTAEAAQSFLAHAWTNGLTMRGHRVMVTHNRIKARAVPVLNRSSRVLIITGHIDFVNVETLTRYFQTKFVFQLDSVKELVRMGQRAVVEFRFGSYRCQSQMAKMALEREQPIGFEKAEFGDDPCEVGENYSSYALAAERIQGKGL